MTYEEFLDEVTTLLTEMYDLSDEAAIKLVVDAQAADYFVTHDDKEELRTLEQARLDAAALHKAKQDKNDTQRKQQQRHAQSKKKPG
jgi:competence protein ComGC